MDENFDEISQIEQALPGVDLVVACVGDTLSQNGEFHDRADLNLSGKQQAMLEAVKASGSPLVVALIASKPLSIPWIAENADALVCGFNPGPYGGEAFKQVLFGEHNPSGKLTVSFPVHVGQLPVYYNKYVGWHAQSSGQLNGERTLY